MTLCPHAHPYRTLHRHLQTRTTHLPLNTHHPAQILNERIGLPGVQSVPLGSNIPLEQSLVVSETQMVVCPALVQKTLEYCADGDRVGAAVGVKSLKTVG